MNTYQDILLATDFSDAGEAAARQAVELARCFDAKLTLLHVVDYFPEDMPVDYVNPEDVDPTEYLAKRSRESLAQLARRLGCEDAQQEVIFTTHSAKHEVVQFAEQHAVDLIVVGSHGHHGLSVMLGSTTDGILHRAHCDVLAVRSKSQPVQ